MSQDRDAVLYESACWYFGTWKKALTAAGINVKNTQAENRYRSIGRKKLVQKLIKRHEAGQSLDRRTVYLEDRNFGVTIQHVFRSWNRAMIAAGFESELTVMDDFTPETIIVALQERQSEGKSVRSYIIHKEDRKLYNAVRRHFGSWQRALRQAGLVAE